MENFLIFNTLNFVALLTLVILRLHASSSLEISKKQKRIWNLVLSFAIISAVMDIASWGINELEGEVFIVLNYAVNIGLFLGYSLLSANLALFLYYGIRGEKNYGALKRGLSHIVSLTATLCFVTVHTGWVFSVDASNIYSRGPAYIVMQLLIFLPMLLIVGIILVRHSSKLNKILKNNRYLLWLISVSIIILGSTVYLIGRYEFVYTPIQMVVALALLILHLMLMSNVVAKDNLTGLQNINGLEKYFNRLPKISQSILAVLFFDLDDFKPINDKYGHRVGDVILKDFAQILLAEVKHKDIASRLGGDEFVVALQIYHEKEAERFVDAIKNAVEKYNNDNNIAISFSCGFAVLNVGEEIKKEELIEKADKEMYKDKNKKKMA